MHFYFVDWLVRVLFFLYRYDFFPSPQKRVSICKFHCQHQEMMLRPSLLRRYFSSESMVYNKNNQEHCIFQQKNISGKSKAKEVSLKHFHAESTEQNVDHVLPEAKNPFEPIDAGSIHFLFICPEIIICRLGNHFCCKVKKSCC